MRGRRGVALGPVCTGSRDTARAPMRKVRQSRAPRHGWRVSFHFPSPDRLPSPLSGVNSSSSRFGAVNDWVRFYTGTYTRRLPHVRGTATGIECFELCQATGALRAAGHGLALANPSFLACGSQAPDLLYAVGETSDFDGQGSGAVHAVTVEPESGELRLCASTPSQGPCPARVSLDRTGRFLFLANYEGGNVAVVALEANGSFGGVTSNHRHFGSGPNLARQSAPHPHAFVVSPCNRFAYAPDLGTDRVVAYAFDEQDGSATPRPDFDVVAPAGSGPRYLAFDDGGAFAFLLCELSSELIAYRVHDGQFTACARASTLPAGWTGSNLAAEVCVAADGTVYTSNRGHDSLAVFTLDRETERLRVVQIVQTGGATPRHFALSPNQAFVVVAHQDSNDLRTFRRAAGGLLETTGHSLSANTPVCVLFAGSPLTE
jgi:6-phosphogluconolactonase